MSVPVSTKRPTGLVSDSRERAPAQRRPTVRFISVDNVLAGRSDIQSGQQRGPPVGMARPADPRGRTIPTRSTKLSEKLVLLPETDSQEPLWSFSETAEDGPLRDDENPTQMGHVAEAGQPTKTYAERLPKERRAKSFSRVTAYCTADGYRLNQASEFFKKQHLARTKLYDECLYCAYHLPLMSGTNGYRIRSSPVLKSPGGKPVVDVHLEESERADYDEYYQFANRDHQEGGHDDEGAIHDDFVSPGTSPEPQQPVRRASTGGIMETMERAQDADLTFEGRMADRNNELTEHMKNFGEVFIFSYGVIVFWNFTERQEKDILADMTFASSETSIPIIREALNEQDFETEEFHFEYSPDIRIPRIFNDMITLRSGDMMVKLAISHAIAQSTKLCLFEERMAKTMLQAHHIPKRLALTGSLGMKREEVYRLSGELFRLRVDANLSSNILDVPEFFWDSEPTLHPLYQAVREYLEIKHRITVLNERCRVFLDLAQLLADSIADSKMSGITWIIIILIGISLVVTIFEVILRYAILSGVTGSNPEPGKLALVKRAVGVVLSRKQLPSPW